MVFKNLVALPVCDSVRKTLVLKNSLCGVFVLISKYLHIEKKAENSEITGEKQKIHNSLIQRDYSLHVVSQYAYVTILGCIILIPGTCEYATLILLWEIILNYLDGPNVITRSL